MKIAVLAKVGVGKKRNADEFFEALHLLARITDAKFGIHLEKEATAHVCDNEL